MVWWVKARDLFRRVKNVLLALPNGNGRSTEGGKYANTQRIRSECESRWSGE